MPGKPKVRAEDPRSMSPWHAEAWSGARENWRDAQSRADYVAGFMDGVYTVD